MNELLDRVSVPMTVWLVVVWLLVFTSIEPLIVVSGILVAIAVQVLLPLPHTGIRWTLRPKALIRLIYRFLTDLIVASWQVTLIVVTGRKVTNGVVHVRMTSPDPVHLTIMSALTSLVPGSLVVKVDRQEGALDLHVLDLPGQGGPRAVRGKVLSLEHRLLAAVAGTPIRPEPNPRLVSRKGSR